MLKNNFKVMGLLALLSLAPNLKAAWIDDETKRGMDATLNDLIQRHKELTQRFAQCDEVVREKDEVIKELQADLTASHQQVETLSQSLTDRSVELRSILDQAEAEKKQAVNVVVRDFQHQIGVLQIQVDQLQAQIHANEQAFNDAQKEIMDSRTIIESLSTHLEQSQKMNKRLEEVSSTRVQQNKELSEQNQALRQRFEAESRQATEAVRSWLSSISGVLSGGEDVASSAFGSVYSATSQTSELNSQQFFRPTSPTSSEGFRSVDMDCLSENSELEGEVRVPSVNDENYYGFGHFLVKEDDNGDFVEVSLEKDGSPLYLQQLSKTALKDLVLKNKGWTIVRIVGDKGKSLLFSHLISYEKAKTYGTTKKVVYVCGDN